MPTDDPPQREPAKSTLGGKLVALGGVVISAAYLANLTAGVIPLEIPDVLPGVGNLDEVFFSGVLIASLAKLGINIIPGMSGNRPPKTIEGKTDSPR
jgi:hypothetical protein